MSSSQPRGTVRAMSPGDWDDLFKRKMIWSLTRSFGVHLRDPVSGKDATAPTIKMAYDKLRPKK